MSPFQAIDYLTVKKRNWCDLTYEEQKAFNPYMGNRFLSMDPEWVDVVNLIQLCSNIPPQQVYQLYSGFLPSHRLGGKYIKKTVDKFDDNLLKVVIEHFQINRRVAKEYIQCLSKEALQSILYSNGFDTKEIAKLLK